MRETVSGTKLQPPDVRWLQACKLLFACPARPGALAQLVERCLCKADVRSSNLLGSTKKKAFDPHGSDAFFVSVQRPYCVVARGA